MSVNYITKTVYVVEAIYAGGAVVRTKFSKKENGKNEYWAREFAQLLRGADNVAVIRIRLNGKIIDQWENPERESDWVDNVEDDWGLDDDWWEINGD